ncbi:MAG: YlxM family DNA-binding protein [Oscillospiraceae bacterium]|nr:YlxM family DNA-binding protein [Oscillospiraceae bacterium]
MDAFEKTLLFDHYGELLTQRQRLCFEMYFEQDLSLAEIAEELSVSRQGVYDNLNRAEAAMRNMEEKLGCVRRTLRSRQAVSEILKAVESLRASQDPRVQELAETIAVAANGLEE